MVSGYGSNQRTPTRLHRFFEDYKKNENKEVRVDDILGSEEAKKAVIESLVSNNNFI